MGIEIEVKYLVESDEWVRDRKNPVGMTQAYVGRTDRAEVRVRIAEQSAWLTVKSSGPGMSRAEFEYSVPVEDASSMMEIATGSVVEKTRWQVSHQSHEWVVDEYHGDLLGLVIAELELVAEGELFELPVWASLDVTNDVLYKNASLASRGLPGKAP